MGVHNNILMVGCGGIGCELLKLLALKHVKDLTIVDNDTIEITNLNRQFVFSKKDIGKFKAVVAKSFYLKMVPMANIVSYSESIISEKFDLPFFAKFSVVYNCLDNVEARSFVNLRCRLAGIPLIDGGSAGYLGQSMVFFKDECYDCTEKIHEQIFPICTIKGRPENFVHCISYAKDVVYADISNRANQNKKKYNMYCFLNKKEDQLEHIYGKILKYYKKLKKMSFPIFDKNNRNIVKFIYYVALERAKKYKIKALTFFEALKIIKNIIPSICTTNSMVASLMLISTSTFTHNFFLTKSRKLMVKQYLGQSSPTCNICSTKWFVLRLKSSILSIKKLFEMLGLENMLILVKNRIYDNTTHLSDIEVEHNSTLVVKSNQEILRFYVDISSKNIEFNISEDDDFFMSSLP